MVAATGAMQRGMRHPNHPFSVKVPPFCIQPTFIAPVLAGETMKNMSLQARVVTDPIKNRLIGWHTEFYVFYVKLTDLDDRDTIVDMLLDPTKDITGIDDPTLDPKMYHPAGTGMINYVKKCQDVVVRNYFRDEKDLETAYTVTNGTYTWPVAQINGNNPFDSMFERGDESNIELPGITVGVDDIVYAHEIDETMRQWAMLRDNNLTEMTYEDYLATFGVKLKAETAHRPELIRYIRDWSYPTNTVEPTTGVPTSAVSWTVQARADKDRMFKEPGFICGYTLTRPKVYLRNQTGSFTATMNKVQSWLPALWQHDKQARRLLQLDNVGPFPAGSDTGGYWYDIADLFLYGEQFVNYALSSTTDQLVPLPAADLVNKRYPTTFSWIQEFFAGTTPAALVQMDGVASFGIASSLKDVSPRGGPVITL